MLEMLILLLFAKLQEYYETQTSAWQWAIAYAFTHLILNLLTGDNITVALINSLILGLYAWGYFLLLRRVSNHLILWLSVYIAGAILPLLLFIKLISLST